MNMYLQDFKKDMKKKISWNFSLSKGQPSQTISLPPANLICVGQVGNCFLTLKVYSIYCLAFMFFILYSHLSRLPNTFVKTIGCICLRVLGCMLKSTGVSSVCLNNAIIEDLTQVIISYDIY